MFIKKIFIKNFRNLEEITLNLNPKLNLIIGKNGQGKTNFLESIYTMGTAESHRTNKNEEMINWNFKKAMVQIQLFKKETEIKISLLLDKNKKQLKINNRKIEKTSNIIGHLNIVIFSPEDLNLVKGGPANRRQFLNIEVSQVNPYYYHLLKKYRHVLKQRNNLLKEIQKKGFKSREDMLDIWDEQLCTLGSKIIKKRLEVIEKIKILSRLQQRKLTDGSENLNIKYENSFNYDINTKEKDLKIIFKHNLVNNRNKEFKRGYTTLGPHRDDLRLEVNKKDIRKYGSQGQQRTVALSLKLAELEFIKSEIGEYPVLLLDDVFSELDFERREFLLNLIKEKIQTFISTTEINDVKKYKDTASIFEINRGIFKKIS